ncbi:TetR family transcriptional regulator [Streptomyces sp. SID8382]|uniref:TetR/AcrR family transcriptional regulator n=1 Tax=Streptomyces malaysiensis TaxID=92644 RepID=UPI000852B80B|nr:MULTISPECIES: TetR/AcrR family transcriptional regulator [unclassified Streptomyces]MYX61916.1 TetR family transcriptional regulator [Streptomyces sp. SID8382]
MDVPRMKTRDIGRSAIREELARVALGLFSRESFEAVTLDDLAASAGVSRSTFLRYFGSKEEVVLFTFDPLGDQMAEALRARPAGEDHWTALRRAVEPAVAFLSREPAEGLALLHLVQRTPALCARLHEKQTGWRQRLVENLTEGSGSRDMPPLVLHARVAAALECLMAALEHWVAIEGRQGLGSVVDEAFDALVPTKR